MTIFDWFIQGLGYGACAVGAVLLFASVFGIMIGVIGAMLNAFDREDADDE